MSTRRGLLIVPTGDQPDSGVSTSPHVADAMGCGESHRNPQQVIPPETKEQVFKYGRERLPTIMRKSGQSEGAYKIGDPPQS